MSFGSERFERSWPEGSCDEAVAPGLSLCRGLRRGTSHRSRRRRWHVWPWRTTAGADDDATIGALRLMIGAGSTGWAWRAAASTWLIGAESTQPCRGEIVNSHPTALRADRLQGAVGIGAEHRGKEAVDPARTRLVCWLRARLEAALARCRHKPINPT